MIGILRVIGLYQKCSIGFKSDINQSVKKTHSDGFILYFNSKDFINQTINMSKIYKYTKMNVENKKRKMKYLIDNNNNTSTNITPPPPPLPLPLPVTPVEDSSTNEEDLNNIDEFNEMNISNDDILTPLRKSSSFIDRVTPLPSDSSYDIEKGSPMNTMLNFDELSPLII